MEVYKQIVEFIRELFKQPEGLISLHAPVFFGNEIKYLNECISTTYVSSVGKYVDQFECEIAKYVGVKKAVACVNGTSALHLALKLIGVEPGNEVITQPLTFIATANAISYCGANPVFLDVDWETMGLSPEKLEAWLIKNVVYKSSIGNAKKVKLETQNLQPINKNTGRRISGCVPMHTYGHPCRIDEINEICNRYNIPVVEDAAESLGSFYKEKHTGTFSQIGILSFNGNKIITTGGGGMLLFKDEVLAMKAKHLTTQAKIQHPWEFSHDEPGYNFRMPNINAALGLSQLEQLPTFLKSKRKTAEAYKDFFSNLEPLFLSTNQPCGIKFISEPINARSNFWLNCILFGNKKERDEFLKFSNNKGVMTRPAWKLMNELPMFINCQTDSLQNAKEIAEKLVNLPSSVLIEDNY